MNSTLTYLLARAQEPSTYNGLAVLLAGLGLHVNDAIYQAVSHTLSAVAALVGVFLAERAKTNAPTTTVEPPKNP
jgi:hypothetical protein